MPKQEELLQIFAVKANDAINAKIRYNLALKRHYEVLLDKWSTLYNSCEERSNWFVLDRIKVSNHYLNKFTNTIKFLRQRKKDIIYEEQNPEAPKKVYKQIDIEDVKRVPVKMIMEGKGLRGIPSSSDRIFYKIRNERTASCCIYISTNSWYDHGSGEGGDVISLYQKLHNVDFKEAIKELNNYI